MVNFKFDRAAFVTRPKMETELHHVEVIMLHADCVVCKKILRLLKKTLVVMLEVVVGAVAFVVFGFTIVGPPALILDQMPSPWNYVLVIACGLLQLGELIEIDRIYNRQMRSALDNSDAWHKASVLQDISDVHGKMPL
jgi:hypothetical protein